MTEFRDEREGNALTPQENKFRVFREHQRKVSAGSKSTYLVLCFCIVFPLGS